MFIMRGFKWLGWSNFREKIKKKGNLELPPNRTLQRALLGFLLHSAICHIQCVHYHCIVVIVNVSSPLVSQYPSR